MKIAFRVLAKRVIGTFTLSNWKENAILNTRLMFATDYITIRMEKELGGLDKYFDNFSAFNTALLGDNARDFFKI